MPRAKKRTYFVETLGSPVLNKISTPVEVINENIQELSRFMIDSMVKFNGIGLAAPQIGRGIRMVVLGVSLNSISEPPTQGELALLPQMPLTIINPKIISKSENTIIKEEGCLSVPGIWGDVERAEKITLKATLLNGTTVEFECGGMLARCIQHELDHLDGLTFIDRLDKKNMAKVEVKIKNLRREGGRNNYRKTL